MAETVRFQDPGEGIHEAEVIEVLVSSGDTIEEGQEILVVETDKADFDVQSPQAGVVAEVHVEVGDTVRVGETLLTLGSDEAAAREAPKSKKKKKGKKNEKKEQKKRRKQEQPEQDARAEADEEHEEAPGDAEDRDAPEAPEDDEDRDAPEAPEDDEEEQTREASEDTEEEEDAPEPRRAARDRGGRPVPASPATRRLARELEIDLRDVTGSGRDGRVLAHDVRAFASGAAQRAPAGGTRPSAPAELPDFSRWGPVERAGLRSVRRTIARRMTRSWEEIPHVAHDEDVDITALESFRSRQAERIEEPDERPTLTALAMKAVAAALQEFPRFNASVDMAAEEIVYKRYFHLGIAVDTPRGLVVPSVRDVDRKSVRQLAREVVELGERARNGRLKRDEMQRGTFTISNVGGIGGRHFTPIINHPQVAILGMGRAGWEPRVVPGAGGRRIEPRYVLPLSLGFDHRVNDGADAARFMRSLAAILSDPEWFALST